MANLQRAAFYKDINLLFIRYTIAQNGEEIISYEYVSNDLLQKELELSELKAKTQNQDLKLVAEQQKLAMSEQWLMEVIAENKECSVELKKSQHREVESSQKNVEFGKEILQLSLKLTAQEKTIEQLRRKLKDRKEAMTLSSASAAAAVVSTGHGSTDVNAASSQASKERKEKRKSDESEHQGSSKGRESHADNDDIVPLAPATGLFAVTHFSYEPQALMVADNFKYTQFKDLYIKILAPLNEVLETSFNFYKKNNFLQPEDINKLLNIYDGALTIFDAFKGKHKNNVDDLVSKSVRFSYISTLRYITAFMNMRLNNFVIKYDVRCNNLRTAESHLIVNSDIIYWPHVLRWQFMTDSLPDLLHEGSNIAACNIDDVVGTEKLIIPILRFLEKNIEDLKKNKACSYSIKNICKMFTKNILQTKFLTYFDRYLACKLIVDYLHHHEKELQKFNIKPLMEILKKDMSFSRQKLKESILLLEAQEAQEFGDIEGEPKTTPLFAIEFSTDEEDGDRDTPTLKPSF